MKGRALLLGVVAAVLLGAGLASASTLHPLLKTPNQVSQLVGDSGHIAWVEKCTVHVYSLATRKRSSVPGCVKGDIQDLALAGGRPFWSEWTTTNTEETWTIYSGGPNGRQEISWASLQCGATDPDTGNCICYSGPSLAEMAADGSSLVYNTDHYECPGGGITSTHYYRVTPLPGIPWHSSLIAGLQDSSLLHMGGGRIGLLVGSTIEIHSPNGELVRAIKPGGIVFDFAFSRTTLAALVYRSPRLGTYIARFSLPSGKPLGALPVSPNIWSLQVSGKRILYQVGEHVIHVQNARSGKRLVVARSKKTIWGSTILGRRVLWSTNQGAHGRIFSIRVP